MKGERPLNCVMVVGSGIAGLMTALELSPLPVILITQGFLGENTSSMLAQGGIAAAYWGEDTPELHLHDTLKAGVGLCDKEIVKRITAMGDLAIKTLEKYGVNFDKDNNNHPNLSLEAAHSIRRVHRIKGDQSGKNIIDQLKQKVRQTPSIQVYEQCSLEKIFCNNNSVHSGILIREHQTLLFECNHIVLATGGIGALYSDSTNPKNNFGIGLALAAEVGALFSDLEFVQFHPTGLNDSRLPKALISEAVRGEGALLVNEHNERFLEQIDGQELAPRDIVARAVAAQYAKGHKVYLDARKAIGKHFPQKFPSIFQICVQSNIDPRRQLIPIQPVEHFHMGGITTTLNGQTSVNGLWAVGECASTGLHGANRLASNSLLEACVMAINTALCLKTMNIAPYAIEILPKKTIANKSYICRASQDMMQSCLGIIRREEGIIKAIRYFLAREPFSNPAKVSLMIAVSALLRKESRGAHFREDFPASIRFAVRSHLTFELCMNIAKIYA